MLRGAQLPATVKTFHKGFTVLLGRAAASAQSCIDTHRCLTANLELYGMQISCTRLCWLVQIFRSNELDQAHTSSAFLFLIPPSRALHVQRQKFEPWSRSMSVCCQSSYRSPNGQLSPAAQSETRLCSRAKHSISSRQHFWTVKVSL